MAGGGVVRDRCAQHEAGLHGIVRRCAQRPRAEPHAASLHVQFHRAGDHAMHDPGRESPLCPSACLISCRRDGTSTIAPRRCRSTRRISGRSESSRLQGGVRYDRAWSWAPADGNGTTETSKFNPNPITFEKTVSVRGFNDITPRFGLSYDLFGNGRTALKVQGGKYLEAATGDVIYSSNNPGGAHHHAHRFRTCAGACLDRRQPQLRRRLQSAESSGSEQSRDWR